MPQVPGPGARAGAAGADQDIAQQRPDHPTTSEPVAPSPAGKDGQLLAERPLPSGATALSGSAEAAPEIDRSLGAGIVCQTSRTTGANAGDDLFSAGAAPEIASKSAAGFTSPTNRRSRRQQVKLEPHEEIDPPLIIGFDAEWVTEPPEIDDWDADDPDADDACDGRLIPAELPRNRVLSYQYACRFKEREWSDIVYTRAGVSIRHPSKSEAEIARLPERVAFGTVLSIAIEHGIHDGHLRRWPKEVIAAAHWTRADLSAMADFASIKRRFDGVHNTYLTLGKHYKACMVIQKHVRAFQVYLVDTRLLAPGSSKSLAAIGELYGFNKIELDHATTFDATGDPVPYIERMDLLLKDDPRLYETYAIRDAEICTRHVDEMLRFQRDELGLNGTLPPPTLGSLAVRHLLNVWRSSGVDADAVLGRESVQTRHFNPKSGRYLTRVERKPLDRFALYEPLAKQAYHGGRNECFWYGPTIDTDAEHQPPFREYDLISAYVTVLASLRVPDYANARPSSDPADFAPHVLGFARIRFRFPERTRFPSLPVPAADDHGLIYPLEGETYATAPEIAVARRHGARIDILDGVILPWRRDGSRPFRAVIDDLIRRRAQHPKGSLPNEMYKQLGNSLYGKLGQGLKGRTAYNTRFDRHERIGPSEITNPYLAAHVTGFVRAAVSEMIAGIPPDRYLISVTTDGFLTNARLDEIDQTGPVAALLAAVRRDPTGNATLLEPKYEVTQLLPWRTRGVATLKRRADALPKLARGGMREPGRMSLEEANDWFARAMLTRQPADQWSSDDPLPFPKPIAPTPITSSSSGGG
jgi:hypothetical protein